MMNTQSLIGSVCLGLYVAFAACPVAAKNAPNLVRAGSDTGFLFKLMGSGPVVPAPAPALRPETGHLPGTRNLDLVSRYSLVSIDYPGAPRTMGSGINDLGQSTGWFSFTPALYPMGDTPVVFANNRFRVIDIPGSVWGEASGINIKGVVVGEFQDDGGVIHGFYWQSGMAFARQINVPGSLGSGMTDNNDAGKMVGGYWDAAGRTHGFLYENGIFTKLDFPGALDFTSALGINNLDEIVGLYNDAAGYHGYRYRNGVYTPIDFPEATFTGASGNNDSGQVVGWYDTSDGGRHGFVMSSSGTFSTLDVVGAKATILAGINNKGRIIGRVQDPQGEFHNLLATPGLLFPGL